MKLYDIDWWGLLTRFELLKVLWKMPSYFMIEPDLNGLFGAINWYILGVNNMLEDDSFLEDDLFLEFYDYIRENLFNHEGGLKQLMPEDALLKFCNGDSKKAFSKFFELLNKFELEKGGFPSYSRIKISYVSSKKIDELDIKVNLDLIRLLTKRKYYFSFREINVEIVFTSEDEEGKRLKEKLLESWEYNFSLKWRKNDSYRDQDVKILQEIAYEDVINKSSYEVNKLILDKVIEVVDLVDKDSGDQEDLSQLKNDLQWLY